MKFPNDTFLRSHPCSEAARLYLKLLSLEMILQYKSNQLWLENVFNFANSRTICQLQGQRFLFLARGSLGWFKVPNRGWRAGSTWGYHASLPCGRAGEGQGCLAKAFQHLCCSRAGIEPCVLPASWHVVFSLHIQMSHCWYKIHCNASLHFFSVCFSPTISMNISTVTKLSVNQQWPPAA